MTEIIRRKRMRIMRIINSRMRFFLIRGQNYSNYSHSFLNICTKLLFYYIIRKKLE